MKSRTSRQFNADIRRSHRARARAEQNFVRRLFRNKLDGLRAGPAYDEAMAISARLARKHLNFILCGEYGDFV